MVVISASGMCEGGRILHHLKNGIENPLNSVLITGVGCGFQRSFRHSSTQGISVVPQPEKNRGLLVIYPLCMPAERALIKFHDSGPARISPRRTYGDLPQAFLLRRGKTMIVPAQINAGAV